MSHFLCGSGVLLPLFIFSFDHFSRPKHRGTKTLNNVEYLQGTGHMALEWKLPLPTDLPPAQTGIKWLT